jgi:tetratricopeptide (TPR) repeat protein
MDIVSLACLTAVVPFAFRSPKDATLRHGADLVGLARWVEQAGRHDEAVQLFRRAVELGLPDDLLFKTMWEIARLEKKLERYEAALALYTDLAAAKNAYRVPAYEELAKHYERRERNHTLALEMTRSALALEDSEPLRRREERLKNRLTGPAKTKRCKISQKL